MDTLELIRTFREVAQRGSFSAAARTLDLSRPNVSKYVAELETRVGVRLLNRTTRNVSLTDAGSLLLERSTPLMEMIDLTRAELQGRALVPSGRLRLTAPHGLAQTGLPGLLGEFMREYPAVTLSLHLDNRVTDMVDEGIDIALRVGRIGDDNLIVRKLQAVPFVVAASPGYWAERGLPGHPDDLAGHYALTYSVLGPNPEWRFEVGGEPLSVPVSSRMDASDAAPLVSVALQGLGMVWLPRLLLQPHIDSGALQPVLQDFSPRDVWLYAAYVQRRHNSAALKALLAFLETRWRNA
ncbi:MAG: LysR family transcriptional regulator [Comamonadaceae bacterium]|jgi:DNA-binding transcriptional LysR family regulator|uniref:LysR family transcriptional regulator n=1 Tax=Candidatus Skiveiella danica TaxID=3386177 RepID=UPI0009CA7D3B|nr:LysR family transcriptional regulator [Comamonadaceae bacterium]MBK9197887.1 LysR family transcriptional regulator [Betaproteobacteria bacterium]MBP8100310.1 LysR family transcriptional regulator [Burkholderiaceae bacterium]OQC15230.1 MAG: HTH-type transcriptional regulator DmlR [Alphaproteobacteria bacterium ADurb.Bin100]MBK6928056.1 LysR family transcriptional regulator [Comamonadaceae bacterium]